VAKKLGMGALKSHFELNWDQTIKKDDLRKHEDVLSRLQQSFDFQ